MEKSTYKALKSIIDNKQLHWYCGGYNVVTLIPGISRDLEAAQKLVAQLEGLTIKQNDRIAEIENTIADNGYDTGLGVEGELKDLSRKTDVLNETISTFTCSNDNRVTYADKTKRNLLVIKSQESTTKISERKKEVAEVLKNIPIVDTRFSQTGNLVVNFPNEECRDSATTLIQDNVGGAVTKKVKKLLPKIMICNVHEEEDDVMDAVIEKIVYLQSISNVSQKMTFLFKKSAASHTVQYIIKCDPEVRRVIHDHDDKILLRWGRYQIRDRSCVDVFSMSKAWPYLRKTVILRKMMLYVVSVVVIIRLATVPQTRRNVSIVLDRRGRR